MRYWRKPGGTQGDLSAPGYDALIRRLFDMTWEPDYALAVPWPAHPSNYGYGEPNEPKAFCIHVPEEPADPHGGTPLFFAQPNRDASTTYFVTHAGGVYQMVPECEGAYANAVQGKPYPGWADPQVNLNLQTLSVEVEGYAGTIDGTMPFDSPQWNALAGLVYDRCQHYGIPMDRAHVFGHYEVSNQRTCPGKLPLDGLVYRLAVWRRDEYQAAIGKVVANLMKLALNYEWQQLADALAAIGVRPQGSFRTT